MPEGRGLVLVLAGEGAGRALGGMLLRALGQGMNVLICLPDRPAGTYGYLAAAGLAGRLAVKVFQGASLAVAAGARDRYDVVMVPEVELVLAAGAGPALQALLQTRPKGQHVVLTCRGDPAGLMPDADMVTRFERKK